MEIQERVLFMDIMRIEALADEAAGLAELVNAVSIASSMSEGYDKGLYYLSELIGNYAERMENLKIEVFADAKKARAIYES